MPEDLTEEYDVAVLLAQKDARIAALEAEILDGNHWLNARAAVLQELAEANARNAELEAAHREDVVYRVAAADAVESLRARIAALEAENAKLKAKLMAAVGEICDNAERAAVEGKDD